jgi:hypothetical protein
LTRTLKIPPGIKVIIGFHIFSFAIWSFGQTGAVIDYDRVAEWGLQDPRVLIDPVIVAVNSGIGLADTIIMLPFFVVATIGLLRMRFYGAVASWLAFGMTLYWPTVFWCTQGFYAAAGITHVPTSPLTVVLPGVFLLVAAWGSWYLGRNRRLLA